MSEHLVLCSWKCHPCNSESNLKANHRHKDSLSWTFRGRISGFVKLPFLSRSSQAQRDKAQAFSPRSCSQMMLCLLPLTPHRHWIATQRAGGLRASPLLFQLPPGALISYLPHLPESLSRDHRAPYFNHALEWKTLFQLTALPLRRTVTREPQCAISSISR